jgi:hypothetical protein
MHERRRRPDAVSLAHLQRSTRAGAAGEHVITRQDAVARWGEGHVRAQRAARRWQMPAGRVVVQHNGPLTPRQKLWVTLLAMPPGGLLHGLTAAREDGLRGLEPDRPTVVIPGASRSPRGRSWTLPDSWDVEVRWSWMLGAEDVDLHRIPPRSRLPRSVVDAASERVADNRARVVVLAAVQQSKVSPPALWDALSRRGRCRNRAVIAEAIVDATGGIESLPEREFDAIRARSHLPRPVRQSRVQAVDGRYFLDCDWPDRGVRVEIHGILIFGSRTGIATCYAQTTSRFKVVACSCSPLTRCAACRLASRINSSPSSSATAGAPDASPPPRQDPTAAAL